MLNKLFWCSLNAAVQGLYMQEREVILAASTASALAKIMRLQKNKRVIFALCFDANQTTV